MSNRNIELGTFTWDSNKLSDQVAANYIQLGRLKSIISESTTSVKNFNKIISDLEKKIEDEHNAQKQFNEMLEQGVITQAEFTEAINTSNEAIEEFITEQEQAVRAQAELAISITTTQREISELNAEQRELNRLLAAGREEIAESDGAYKRLTTELSAAKTEAKNLGAQLIEMEKAGLKESDPELYSQIAAQFAEISTRARELNDQLLAVDQSVGDNQRNVGNYKEAFTSAFSEISDGAAQMASGNIQAGFESIKSGFNGIKTAATEAYAFILANPLTALLALFLAIGAGIYKGVNAMIEYNESIKESIKLTQNLTGTIGKLSDQIRIRAQGLSDTFGDDFKEVLTTANTLSKQLGITFEEAFNKIEQGYIRGANANGDFLDRLSEYGPLLNKYGFDLDQIIGLQIQAQEQGLFGDKFEDSIKEAGISLEEFEKAQSDALTSAFGKDFSDKISKDINSGVITVKDALILMAAEAKKQGLSVQQFGILTADVFKGAGEDVGGAQKMFEDIYEGINNLDKPLTAIQQKTLKLSEANYELAKAKDEAMKSSALMEFMSDLDFFLIKAETIYYKFIGLLTESMSWIDKLTGTSEVLGETWDALSDNVDALWDVVQDLVDVFTNLLTTLGFNNKETQAFMKILLKAMNPLNLIKGALNIVTTALKLFSQFIQVTGVNFSAFGIATKSIFAQIVDAAKSFINLDFEGGLSKLKNINISKEFKDARVEAERIFALNKANRNKKIVEDVPVKDVVKNNGGLTQAEKDAAAKAAEEARKKAEAEAKKAENKKIADAMKAAEEAKKALEEEAKRAIEIAKNEADQKAEIAKTELAKYILDNAEKLKNDKSLLKSKLDQQYAYYEEVRKLQQQANNIEEAAKAFAIEQKIDEINKKKVLNQNDFDELKNLDLEKQNLHREYYNKELELNADTNEKRKELNKKYEADIQEQKDLKQALSFQKRISDLETQHIIESAIQRVQLDEDTEQRLEQFLKENELKRQLDQEEYDLNSEIVAQRKELENEIALLDDENEKIRLQNKLDQLNVIESQYASNQKKLDKAVNDAKLEAYASAFGSIKSLFGESTAVGKAAAIAETTINTYKAATAAYAAGASLGGPLGAVMGPILAGLAVASGLSNVKKIVSVKADKAAKGKLIKGPSHDGGGVPISTPNGIIEAEGGEPILTKKAFQMFPGLISDINVAGGGVPLYANGGVIGSNLATVQNTIKTINPVITLDSDAVGLLQDAIYSGSQNGLSDLAQNRKIANDSNF